jgi:Ca2+-binding RTX toxin-like protein
VPFNFSDELILNSMSPSTEVNSSATALKNGNYVVVFSDFANYEVGDTSIRAQIVSADNSSIGPSFLVDDGNYAIDDRPEVQTLADGRFVVVWISDPDGDGTELPKLNLRMFDPDGSPVSGIQDVNTTMFEYIRHPNIAATADGGFAITWGGDVFAQYRTLPFARVFNPNGVALDNDFIVSQPSSNSNYGTTHIPVVAGLTDGDVAYVWTSSAQEANYDLVICAQLKDTAGNAVSAPLIISEVHDGSSGMRVSAHDPRVIALSNGNWVASWWHETTVYNGTNFSDHGIKFRLFDRNGGAITRELDLIATAAFEPQSVVHKICALADGRFAIFWESSGSLNAEVFQPDGKSCGEEIEIHKGIAGSVTSPTITMLAHGGFAVTWDTHDNVGFNHAVHTVTVNLKNFDGSDAHDMWKGGSFAEVLLGRGGADTLIGFGGNDRIDGGSGNDHLAGGTGNDTIKGGTGKDFIDGGNGVDTLAGGSGADMFHYQLASQAGDKISGFADDDTFGFKGSAFGIENYTGNLHSAQFVSRGIGHNAADSGDRFIYDRSSDQLWFDADGTGAKKAIMIADIATDANVAAADILIL